MIRVVIEHKTKDKEETRKLVKIIQLVHAKARKQHGYIRGSTLVNVADPRHVVVLSSWQTVEDSKAWDESKELKSLNALIEEHLVEPRTAGIMTDNVIWKEEIAHVFD
jgi:heme-degrading monooxygenase HmoA